jgi:hypothetical protein
MIELTPWIWLALAVEEQCTRLPVYLLVLIAALIDVSSVSDDVLVAAALLWRVFYSVIPLPAGAIRLSRFQKANPDALRRGAVYASGPISSCSARVRRRS